MPANTQAIFPLTPNIFIAVPPTTANTTKTGTGAVNTILIAGPNGAYVEDIRVTPKGTNAATVLRVFLNNGGDNNTATNNVLMYELSCPASTVDETAAQTQQIILVEKAIPANYRLLVTVGTTVTAGLAIVCTAGNY